MNYEKVNLHIVEWLRKQITETKQKGFVVGVSGGIDSAVVSTLCAKSGFPVIVLNMPIHQIKEQFDRAEKHINWLKDNFNNVSSFTTDLTLVYENLCSTFPLIAKEELALANTRSRLRMLTLYSFANSNNYLVCGTGNKIEDFAIGFFTKYGDGGVDISPIGDLMKSEVYALGKFLGVDKSILEAAPTDGLWEVDRTDEEQIGASYDELEWAMLFMEDKNPKTFVPVKNMSLSERQKEVLNIYITRHLANRHKMEMPEVCFVDKLRN